MAITKEDKDNLCELAYLAATDHVKERVYGVAIAELLATTNSIAEFNEGMSAVETGLWGADISEYGLQRIRVRVQNLARSFQSR